MNSGACFMRGGGFDVYEEPLMYSQFCYYIQKDEEKLFMIH